MCEKQRCQEEKDNPVAFKMSKIPLALPFDVAGLGVVTCCVDPVRQRLATVGNDRVIKIWDVKELLKRANTPVKVTSKR